MTLLTTRFVDAVGFALEVHGKEKRKHTEIPYLSHLLAVASLVLDHGGNEDEAIAALLHDSIEDGGEAHRTTLRERFGERVARLVEACTDGTREGKALANDPASKAQDWMRRKLGYLRHLEQAEDPGALLVSACDKLHNTLTIVRDVDSLGVERVYARFEKVSRETTLANYESLTRLFERRGPDAVAKLLRKVVDRMHEQLGVRERRTLEDSAAQA